MLAIVSLTKGGAQTAKRIHAAFPDADCYGKWTDTESIQPIEGSFTQWMEKNFNAYSQWIFIMATGIVVRSIAPLLKHKSQDPAVLAVDEKGTFVISLLSGHLGGANALACDLAEKIEGTPVITTASDVQGVTAVDELAKGLDLVLDDFPQAKAVTADLVNGKPVGLYSKNPRTMDGIKGYEYFWGQAGWRDLESKLKSGAVASFVYVGDEFFQSAYQHVHLYPRQLVVGLGCKKSSHASDLETGIVAMVESAGFSMKGVGALASAWVKAEEEGILDLASKWKIPFVTFEKDQIAGVANQFDGSDFVKKTIGVACVSEPCGYLASNRGICKIPVIRENGMTLSLWQVKEEKK